MHLQRVQVPNFRALKNIDITFEKERIPRIFPLASLNGGGKSTLLQLIFTLLTCSADPDKHEFLVNILKDFEVDSPSRTIASIELLNDENTINLEFSVHYAQYMTAEISNDIRSDNLHYICSYKSGEYHSEINIICQIKGNNKNADILQKISKKVFLAAPASQVFLFFSRQEIDCLFGNKDNGASYENTAQKNQDRLSGFFLHDFSTIKILAKAFENAFENDRQQAIQTRGQYGTDYAKISKDLEYVFSGKIIEPLKDLSGIIIKTIENGKERILHPEDLSHGELRRLSFYAWLRTKEIQDSIVLVDEIEIGLHPDWQYQIVKDLEEWAPSNQYILATHSYEICSALTPAHVKEIEPKLVKP